jgi:hypothetical protein
MLNGNSRPSGDQIAGFFLRNGVKQQYGNRAEKLVELGLAPLRAKAKAKSDPKPPATPPPSPTPHPTTA